MASVTTGGFAPAVLNFDDGSAITVRAPGVVVQVAAVAPPPAMAMAAEAAVGGGGWDEAIAANGLAPAFQPLEVHPLAAVESLKAMAMPILSMPGSDDAHIELEARPAPGEGLLLMARNGDVVQWFLPLNAAPATLRFRVPQSFMTSSVGTSPAGFRAFAAVAPVLRFFRFEIVPELVEAVTDGAVERIAAWVAKEVEGRAKSERLLCFDPARGYPPVAPSEVRGPRVLLLTHGIFATLSHTFAALATPGNALLRHLQTVYGADNIIGWDHYTVSKTPLENARDLLNALPDHLDVDIVCHSRGALVTRAMFEHKTLQALTRRKIRHVGTAIFVAGANQGSALARFENLNRLLNIYSAIASVPLLGAAGVVLGVIVGVLRVLAHGAIRLPGFVALNPDPKVNAFLAALNGPTTTAIHSLVVAHANYDAKNGLLREYLDFNVDVIMGAANDMVVPYRGAEVFDRWLPVAAQNNYRFGTATAAQSTVMHTNFFYQDAVQAMLRHHLA